MFVFENGRIVSYEEEGVSSEHTYRSEKANSLQLIPYRILCRVSVGASCEESEGEYPIGEERREGQLAY
jgi:hypothetical protein